MRIIWLKRSFVLLLPLCSFAVATIVVRTEARPTNSARSAQLNSSGVTVGTDNIGGVVTGSKGPEAGVWVIAEQINSPTKFAKIVVTDDQGRYLVPDLPKGNYQLWVRGYGLVDSKPVAGAPGTTVALTAVVGPEPSRRGPVLSRRLLGFADEDPHEERISDDHSAAASRCWALPTLSRILTQTTGSGIHRRRTSSPTKASGCLNLRAAGPAIRWA